MGHNLLAAGFRLDQPEGFNPRPLNGAPPESAGTVLELPSSQGRPVLPAELPPKGNHNPLSTPLSKPSRMRDNGPTPVLHLIRGAIHSELLSLPSRLCVLKSRYALALTWSMFLGLWIFLQNLEAFIPPPSPG